MTNMKKELFNYFRSEHDIMLLDSDMNEVVNIVKSGLNNSAQAEALSVDNNEQAKEVCICQPLGVVIYGSICKSCGKIFCQQTD